MKEIVETMDQVSTVQRPKRREYSQEFKVSALEQCGQPGASLACVAVGHGINPNMVHRWIREVRQRQVLSNLQQTTASFVPLQLPASTAAVPQAVPTPPIPVADETAHNSETIRIEIQRGGVTMNVHWPLAGAAQCAQVLR
jgi:transposase